MGGSVFRINEGVDGMVNGDFHEMHWQEVRGWVCRGGAELGTRRTLANDGNNMAKLVEQLRKFDIHGLLAIGGFEAYYSVLQMAEARKEFVELRIPLIVVPATISNNVPGTDFSLGADTAVNEITEICDRIRQSAQGTKRRVFIIETMGGYCGYLATMAGLAGGADAAYIKEEPHDAGDLLNDIKHMKAKMNEGVQRGLILRNEKSHEFYNTDFITRLYEAEGKNIFSTRANILGHMQQGGSPSPFDRNLGTKMGAKAADWIMSKLRLHCTGPDTKHIFDGEDSAVVIGLKGKGYETTPLQQLKGESDFKTRKWNNQWYMKLRPLLRILAKHDSSYEPQALFSENLDGEISDIV
jgi:6-phosphofructokinase 1